MSNIKNLFQIGYNNLVTDPNRIPWNVGAESTCGTGLWTAGVAVVQPFTGTVCWDTHLAGAGDTAQVSVDDTYATIANVASGAGIVTNIVLPGVTAGGDIVTMKITIDGVVSTIAFTADNATDRFFSGLTASKPSGTGNDNLNMDWADIDLVGGLAFRKKSAIDTNIMGHPNEQLCHAPCLRFESSLLVEMKCSDFSSTTYRDYGAVIYTLDQ